MNAASARFFDTLREMAAYRPQVTPGLDLLGAAVAAGKEIKKALDSRKAMKSWYSLGRATKTRERHVS